jgi:hypothetical protein
MVALVPMLLAGCGGLEPGGYPVIATPAAGLFPPSAVVHGKTYGEWSAAWWQWALLPPASRNPVVDATGEFADVGQSGPVWFLAGTFGGTAERTCTIPAGKCLFFPIIDSICWLTEPSDTEAMARRVNADNINHVTDLELSIDAEEIEGLRSFRFTSPEFQLRFDPLDPVWPAPPGPYRAFSEGYFVMLEPLTPGTHTIEFRGKWVVPEAFPRANVLLTVVTYHLTVE